MVLSPKKCCYIKKTNFLILDQVELRGCFKSLLIGRKTFYNLLSICQSSTFQINLTLKL